jgi:enoyl-CoA hydratase/carnithine racemase
MTERVRTSVRDGIADVRLNRPEKLNAIDPAMFAALREAGRSLASDRSLRAVVLSGEGRAFSAGLDFQSFAALARGGSGAGANLFGRDGPGPANLAQSAAWVWHELPVPVVAAVHGVAFGGGLQIALGADVRIVAPDARLSILEIKWGLVPDMSGTQTLRRLLRLDVLKQLAFTGRIVSGEEAVRLGLATEVSPQPLESAFELAREIAAKSPDAIRAAKQLLDAAVAGTEADGLALEARTQGALIGRPNQVEAVRANLEKREPRFRDPEPD